MDNLQSFVQRKFLTVEHVKQIRTLIFDPQGDDGVDVSRKEMDLLFDINDSISGHPDNDLRWKATFIEAGLNHYLGDKVSRGILDESEAQHAWGRIRGDGMTDSTELALMVNLIAMAKSVPEWFIDRTIEEMEIQVLMDRKIDADEVSMMKSVVYGTGGYGGRDVSLEESQLLFKMNDVTAGEDNDPAWKDFFVEAQAKYALGDSKELSQEKAEYLLEQIKKDLNANKKALVEYIIKIAESVPPVFKEFALTI